MLRVVSKVAVVMGAGLMLLNVASARTGSAISSAVIRADWEVYV